MSKYQNENILYYIDALLKYSNYSKAAQSLYISQPYLTQVIIRIEKQLNCELINRNELPYRLTEQGKVYYQYLTAIENSYSKLLREIDTINDIDKQTIKIGVLPSLGTYLLPLFIPKFVKLYPSCQIELIEDLPEINEKRLLNGDLDFWLSQNSSNIGPNLEAKTWGRHRYYSIIPMTSSLYQKDLSFIPEATIPVQDLLKQNLVLTAKGSAIRMQVDHLLSIYKIKPKIVIESSEIYTVQQLAMANMGITFVPESLNTIPNPSQYNIYSLPIDEMNLDYFIAYDRQRKLSKIDHDLINTFLLHHENDQTIGDTSEYM